MEVEAIVVRFGSQVLNLLEVVSAHVAHQIRDPLAIVLLHYAEELGQRIFRPFLRLRQKSADTLIDLVHQRQILVAGLPQYFVDAERRHIFRIVMGNSANHAIANTTED